jgi:membrane-associated phospholipid phosphatase
MDPHRTGGRRRFAAVSTFAVAFAAWWRFIGMPADIISITMWLWMAAIAWRYGRPFREHLSFLRDWLPIVAVLSVYDVSRGRADNNRVPHLFEMVHADRWMFGGHVPTVWLQQHFYDPYAVHWWDAIVSWVYSSHFVLTPAIALVLWLRSRTEWARFLRRWIALSAAGLTTYFLYPAAPPWWGSQVGVIDHVERISSRGWRAIGLHNAGHLLSQAQELSNPVAAMPSLHSAFAMLAVAFFANRVRRRWWPLLAAYPVAMGLSLVYSGEHWVTDVFVGWAYVAVTMSLVWAAERAWARWRGRPIDAAGTTLDPVTVASGPAHPERAGESDDARADADRDEVPLASTGAQRQGSI